MELPKIVSAEEYIRSRLPEYIKTTYEEVDAVFKQGSLELDLKGLEELDIWMDWVDQKVGFDRELSPAWDAVCYYRVCAENIHRLDRLLETGKYENQAKQVNACINKITKYLTFGMPSEKRDYLEDWWQETERMMEEAGYQQTISPKPIKKQI